MRPGRNVCVHVAQIPSQKAKDGVIGLKDFRGDTIRHFQAPASSITARSASTRTRRRRRSGPRARAAVRPDAQGLGLVAAGAGRLHPDLPRARRERRPDPPGHQQRRLDRVGAADLVRHPRDRHAQRRRGPRGRRRAPHLPRCSSARSSGASACGATPARRCCRRSPASAARATSGVKHGAALRRRRARSYFEAACRNIERASGVMTLELVG
jgi:hypothetical protein